MTDLRTFIGSAHEVDLGSGTYELVGDPLVLAGTQLHADGAVINWTPNRTRSCPAIIVRGVGTRLTGTAYVHGPAPMGVTYCPDWEAQHGLEIQGATDAYVGAWQFRNTYGDGIYVGKGSDGWWTTDLTLDGTRTKENGRNGLTLVAVVGADIGNLEMQRANLGIIDVEPPGSGWGAAYVNIHDIVVKDHGGGFVFANKGVGSSRSVHDITLQNISCPNRDFSATVQPPADVRRQSFSFLNCTGEEGASVRLTRCDHVLVQGSGQVTQNDCTDVVIS